MATGRRSGPLNSLQCTEFVGYKEGLVKRRLGNEPRNFMEPEKTLKEGTA